MRKYTAAFAIACLIAAAWSPAHGGESTQAVTRKDGGSIQTVLSANIIVNPDSSLHREWVAVHDPELPADVVGTPGVKTVYERDGRRGDYYYKVEFELLAREPLVAAEVVFLAFDVWGYHARTLSSTDIQDIPEGKTKFEAKWKVYSENEVSEHYASIAYVRRVRTKAGAVVEMPRGTVLKEARRFSEMFAETELEPKKPEPQR